MDGNIFRVDREMRRDKNREIRIEYEEIKTAKHAKYAEIITAKYAKYAKKIRIQKRTGQSRFSRARFWTPPPSKGEGLGA